MGNASSETLLQRLTARREKEPPLLPTIDERKSDRLALSLPIEYAILLSGQLLRGRTVTWNISGGGVAFSVPQMISPQTVCQVSLTLPDQPEPLAFLARVAWCRQGNHREQCEVGVALSAFDSYHEGAFRQYSHFIASQLLKKHLG